MKKKILFVVDEKKLGGVSIVLENILNNLDLKLLDITVLVLHNNGNRLENLNKQIKVIYGNKAFNIIDESFKSLLSSKKYIKALRKLILSYKIKTGAIKRYIIRQRNKLNITGYDIEIAFKAGFCSLFVAYGDAKCKLNWIHEDYASYNMTKKYENTFKNVFAEFNHHIIVSSEAAKSFNNIYGFENKTKVIENYINEKQILEKANEASKHVIDESKINIVTLGRFCNEKGYLRLIDAVNMLNKQDQEKFELYILGSGYQEKEYIDKINEYNLKNIHVINSTNLKENVYAFMKRCDAFIMSSISESFGMVRIEALILGLPVITTNVANTKQMINDNIGIVVENTTEGIYKGIECILQDKSYLNKLKQNVKGYSYEKQNEQIINEIQKMLEE